MGGLIWGGVYLYNYIDTRLKTSSKKVTRRKVEKKSSHKRYKKFFIYDKRMANVRNIAVDNQNGKIALIHSYGWSEIPYKHGKMLFQKGFVAKMKPKFKLTALASIPSSIAAYNEYNSMILSNKKRYKLSNKVKNVLSMAYFRKKFYLVTKGKVWVFKPSGKKAVLTKTYHISNITGITSNAKNIYYCAKKRIFKCNEKFHTLKKRKIGILVTDITFHKDGIFAICKGKPYIYMIGGF